MWAQYNQMNREKQKRKAEVSQRDATEGERGNEML